MTPIKTLLKAAQAAFFCLTTFPCCFSQAQPGLDEFKDVTSEVNDWYYGFADLALAIGAVSGIIGGLRVYSNWQSGSRRIDGQVMGWFFSCLFLSVIGAALKALYGVR